MLIVILEFLPDTLLILHMQSVRLDVITFLSWRFEAKRVCNSKWSIFSFARSMAVRRIWRANSVWILTGVWNRFGSLESACRCY